MNPLRPGRGQRGMSLIEALIALLLLCVGVLGMAALHGRSVQYAVDAEDRNRAAILANELVSLMWAARTTNKDELPTSTVSNWQTRVADATASGLPNAAGTVAARDANGVTKVTITWRPPSRPVCSGGVTSSCGDFSYVTKVALP